MPSIAQCQMYDQRHPKQKWYVTTSYIESGHMNQPRAMDICGPGGCPEDDDGFEWTAFKMYDDDGILYYEGRMNQHCDGLEPLEDFGMPNAGAVTLRVLNTQGKWEIV